MKKFWNRISFLGIDSREKTLYTRTLILGNQLNAIMFMVCIFILIFLTIMRTIENAPFGMGSLRVLVVAVYNLVCLGFSYIRRPGFGKLSLIFLPTFILFVWPTLMGFVEEESFAYYPYILIILSLIPQLVLVPVVEKRWFVAGAAYYLLLLIFIEPFMMRFMPVEFEIVPIIRRIFPYTKMVQISIFFFMQFSVYYLRRLNYRFEQEVVESNQMLSQKNQALNKTLKDLKETQQQLYQLERLSTIGTLTAGMAHEINNPLNYIAGGLDLLEEQNVAADSESKKAIAIIRKGVEKTSKILQVLLSYTGRKADQKEEVDLQEIVDNTLLLLRHTFPEGLNIFKVYELSDPVPAFREKVQKVVLSICENAIFAIKQKNSPGKEYIKVRSFREKCFLGECACLSITNSGPLIPDENISKIFDPFFTTKEVGEGTGLGMSISYMHMKEHDGMITVENLPEGVTFTIKFPFSQESDTNKESYSEHMGTL